MYFLEFYFLGLFFAWVSLYFYYYGLDLIMDWDLLGVVDFVFVFSVYLDWYGLLFSGAVMVIGSLIILYSNWYVGEYLMRFYYLMNLFILSMLLLIYCPSILGMLLGWDGLGAVSFCLIWFYYGSLESIDNSLITMLFNRFGDSLLMVGIGLLGVGLSVWGFDLVVFSNLFSLIFILGLCTKSAQFPFSSWLPKAMAAPTPVSSLVHSSTLVTSGLYILFRYISSLTSSWWVLEFVGLMTLLIGGTSAFTGFDLKKIIAYSTLSQMGFMVFMLGLGFGLYVYAHMLIHAIFKSMMFMCAGVIIHCSGCQDVRMCFGLYNSMPYLAVMLGGSVLSLIGFPFMSGFFSKDILIEMFYTMSSGLFKLLMFSFGILVTPAYGIRLLLYMVVMGYGMVVMMDFEGVNMILSVLFLFYGSIYFGSLFFFVIVDLINLNNFIVLMSVLILFYLLMGIFVNNFSVYNLFFGHNMFYLSFWFVDGFYYLLKSLVLKFSSEFIYFDKVWFDVGLGVKTYDYLYYLMGFIYSPDMINMFYVFLLLFSLMIFL